VEHKKVMYEDGDWGNIRGDVRVTLGGTVSKGYGGFWPVL